MARPDVTVYIPTYNRANFLEECLSALLDQGLPTNEYIVAISDNASCDDTAQVVELFRERLQIQYHRRSSTISALENINGVSEYVETPYFSVLCDDDLLVPGQLGRAMNCLRSHPKACLYAALGLAQNRFGDQSAKVLGAFLDMERLKDEPFLFRWQTLPWLANCSLHTPVTIIGSIFKLDCIPQHPLFTSEFSQEGDRLLLMNMVNRGEIYSAPWIGGHLRYHADQVSIRNIKQRVETQLVTERVLNRARELGYDLPQYWIERLPKFELMQLEFVCERIQRLYPRALSREIMEQAGVYDRWKQLRKQRKRAKNKSRLVPGLIGRLRQLLAR